MATTIEQRPLYQVLPVVQQLMFTIANDTIVNNNFNVKFCAAVHVSNSPIVLSNNDALIGTFKTTPNNAGVGIFDLRPVVETFLKPDNEPQTEITGSTAKYKDVAAQTRIFPIHLIDQTAMSENSCKYLAVNFYIEYSTTALGVIISEIANPTTSIQYTIFNGVVKNDDTLTLVGTGAFLGLFLNDTQDDFSGYNFLMTNISGLSHPANFLSDAPTTQYATVDDYGTFAFLNDAGAGDAIAKFVITYYNDSGTISSPDDSYNTGFYGGAPFGNITSGTKLLYVGGFPANIKQWSSNFATAVGLGLTYYTIAARNASGTQISATYRINILCSNLKNYEPIRLAWLNRWGAWDYYTFNMKSSRTINSKRIPYNQMAGTWNKSRFKPAGYKGGQKSFRVNSTEKIRINTDFVTEAEGVWFQQLINSTEVYILKGYEEEKVDAYTFTITNKYIEPVTVTTSSYTTKTIANDKLMQYTFEIDKSKMERTQAV